MSHGIPVPPEALHSDNAGAEDSQSPQHAFGNEGYGVRRHAADFLSRVPLSYNFGLPMNPFSTGAIRPEPSHATSDYDREKHSQTIFLSILIALWVVIYVSSMFSPALLD